MLGLGLAARYHAAYGQIVVSAEVYAQPALKEEGQRVKRGVVQNALLDLKLAGTQRRDRPDDAATAAAGSTSDAASGAYPLADTVVHTARRNTRDSFNTRVTANVRGVVGELGCGGSRMGLAN